MAKKETAETAAPKIADPVEAAKIAADGSSSAPEVKQSLPPPEPKVDAPPKKPEPGIFVVKNTNKISISWGLQTITFNPGDTVSEDSYGDGAIQKLRDAGVALEPVPAKADAKK